MTSITRDGLIEFRFFRPHVRQVNVVGDFNKWSRTSIAMHPLGGGWWTVTLRLEPGDHRFRYFADGEWYTDFASNGIEKGKWGTNSILVVPESAEPSRIRQVA